MALHPAQWVYRRFLNGGIRILNAFGLNVAKTRDYYSPLPLRRELRKTQQRWDRPSELIGLDYDLDAMKALARELVARHHDDYLELPSYDEAKALGYGPGFTIHDAMWLFTMLRHLKPRRYVEVGSGLSTWYALEALRRNAAEGSPCEAIAVDPYANDRVRSLDGLRIEQVEVQSAPMELFTELGDGDVLFIDSTHVVKLDGDVPHLYLEVVPRLAPGVWVHGHDIHFPFNVPHPAEQYVFRAKWPLYWTESMLLQAFLAFNRDFEIVLSPPLLRHFDEEFLRETVPGYRPVEISNHDTHSGSLWYRRVPEV